MEEKTRCFVAIDLSREAINYIKEVQELIKKQNLFTGKFTESENLHLTLKFLGEIDEKQLEEVKKRLKEIEFPGFEAELGDVGVFSKDFIKIIWIHLKNADGLQRKVDEKLKDIFKSEFRFMSHITIARVKKKVGDKKALLDYIGKMKIKNIRFRVRSFFLKKSELQEEGPVYTDLEEYNLAQEK